MPAKSTDSATTRNHPTAGFRLIGSRLHDPAVALFIEVGPVTGARRLSVEENPKPHGRAWRRGCQDEVEGAGVKAARNPPAGPHRLESQGAERADLCL